MSDRQSSSATDDEVEEVLEALASDARTRIAHVRDGLRSILRRAVERARHRRDR